MVEYSSIEEDRYVMFGDGTMAELVDHWEERSQITGVTMSRLHIHPYCDLIGKWDLREEDYNIDEKKEIMEIILPKTRVIKMKGFPTQLFIWCDLYGGETEFTRHFIELAEKVEHVEKINKTQKNQIALLQEKLRLAKSDLLKGMKQDMERITETQKAVKVVPIKVSGTTPAVTEHIEQPDV